MAFLGEFGAAKRDADPDREVDTFKFYGEEFTVADRVGAMPLLRFAAAAVSGADSAEAEGLSAMHDLLRDCLPADDWRRFQQVAEENKADGDELLAISRTVYQAISGRPTRRPSDSSDGPSSTGASSRVPSSTEVSSTPTWKDTPFGRRELAAHPELYADVIPLTDNGRALLAQTG